MPIRKGLLPREGLYFVPLWKLFARTALNPSLTLLLVLLARFTKRGRDLSTVHPTAYGRIKTFLYLGLFRAFSNWYSDRARNNGVSDHYDWSREIVVVTGGAAGIGAHIVTLLDELGIKVVVLDIQPITYATSSRVHHFTCDLRSPTSVQEVAEKVRSQVGHPTVLVNNAGVARGKTILESEPGDVRFTFDVNTLSHYWITKAFLPNMIQHNHGMVVTVASMAAWITASSFVDYSSSKAAALAFHEGLSAELVTRYRASKVRTVIVQLGHTKTALFNGTNQHNNFLTPSLEIDTVAEEIVKQIISGRSGNVLLPESAQLAAALRMMPDWISYPFRVRTDKIMAKWDGRQVISDVDAPYEKKLEVTNTEKSVDSQATN